MAQINKDTVIERLKEYVSQVRESFIGVDREHRDIAYKNQFDEREMKIYEMKHMETEINHDNFVVNEQLLESLEKLKSENEALKRKMNESEKEQTKKDEQEDQAELYAVPLNDYWNSLSLGPKMYDSLFSYNTETPHVWPDPFIWNIIYAVAPPEYKIPDSSFVNELKKSVARSILEAK